MQALLCVALCLAVTAFGAVPPAALALVGIMASVLLVSAVLRFGPPEIGGGIFSLVIVVVGVTCLWILVQNRLPVAWSYAVVPDARFAQNANFLSVAPADSLYSILYLTVPALFFLTAMSILRTSGDARKFVAFLGYGGAANAVYGIVQYFQFPETSLFVEKLAYTDSVTATFINRNSAATFLGITLLVLSRSLWSLSRRVNWSEFLHNGFQVNSDERKVLFFLACNVILTVITAVALMLTRSRGGVLSSLISLGILAILLRGRGGSRRQPDASICRAPNNRRYFATIFSCLAAILCLVLVFGSQVLRRAMIQGTSEGRLCVMPDIINLVSNHWLGYGFGNFRFAFAPYRNASCGLNFVWDRAHNLYFEGLGGLGLMFVPLAATVITALIAVYVSGIRRHSSGRSYAILGISSLVLVSVHGFVDFSMQIPGIACFVASLVGATTLISLQSGSDRMRVKRVRVRSSEM